jgi:hypothetical protein
MYGKIKKIVDPEKNSEATSSDSDITPVERNILDNINSNPDDELLRRAQPDALDEEGELLNENSLLNDFLDRNWTFRVRKRMMKMKKSGKRMKRIIRTARQIRNDKFPD